MNIQFKNKKGFSLIEIIVGVSILALCLLGIITVGQGFLRLSYQSFQNSQANFLLEEGAEVSRAFLDTSWTNISGLSTGTNYYLTFSGGKWATTTDASLGIIDHVFTRYINVSNVNRDTTTADIVTSGGTLDSGTRKVTVVVTWQSSMVKVTKSAMLYLTNI